MNRKHILAIAAVCVAVVSIATAQQSPRKPRIDDTIKANVYADNSFKLYINGELIAVDSIAFVPHNVVSVDVLPAYPMTFAVMGIDNADPRTGMEYANSNIGDGGFILKLGDGTVTNATWKAKKFSWGPIDSDTNNPRVENIPVPKDWFAVKFDDSKWPNAKEFTEEEVGPKEPYFENDFEGAKFIWSDDVKLDNLVLFRTVVKSPPDGKDRPDFRGLTDVVPQGGGRRKGGDNRQGRPPQPQQEDRRSPQQRGTNRNESQAAKSLFGPDALKKPNASFVLASSAVKNGGKLPLEYTGDGGGSTLPLSWKGAPDGTKTTQ